MSHHDFWTGSMLAIVPLWEIQIVCEHRATVGIALYLKYTNMGIGSIMFEKMIENAYEKGIEQLN